MRTLILATLILGACTTDLPTRSEFAGATKASAVKKIGDPLSQRCGPCAAESDCGANLACDVEAGVCRIQGQSFWSCESECRASEMCILHGWCTPTEDRGCIATSDADCKASADCQQYGKCFYGYTDHGACLKSKLN